VVVTKRVTIAISGTPGSGKTTYAIFLAERYGLRYVSNGQLFRQLAAERGYDLITFHKLAERDRSIDEEIDRRALELAKQGGIVIEGHLAVWVLKDVADIKIIFDAPLEVRARRIAERDNKSFDEALREIVEREQSNALRAEKYYGLNIKDYRVADLVISTYPLDIESVKNVVAVFVDGYKKARSELFE